MIRRISKNLGVYQGDAPPETRQLEVDGYAVIRGVFSAREVGALRDEIDAVFASHPTERGHSETDGLRYQMFNRSPRSQAALAHPRILAVIEPLLGEDCHVIANTAWRNPPEFAGGPWHCDAGPHVPRPEGVPWDERIPYPVFAIGAHLLLLDCEVADGPTAVVPGSHRSGRLPPPDHRSDPRLTYDGRPPALLTGRAGDVALFVSDAWHRGTPADGGRGRQFLQVHYGRRDVAQRVRTTAEVNHVAPEAIARARAERQRTILGLHDPFFYDG
ncbi:MAG TPA: phytanoyl-CoA dioxygenase family protein, partial [Candidatus Methylomirabilis sp.]|nr:phytanoyl-CoA dioxygenase family protein [Candidatus Methylomirabilis sp.]